MRIGILTHHYVSNFGAFLQAWCLEQTLLSLNPGSDVFIVDYVIKKHALINWAGLLRFNPRKESLRAWCFKTGLPGTFKKERARQMRLTKRVHNADEINALLPDALVVGSDEVWNYEDIRSFSPIKFGVGLKPVLIAYAPSVGIVSDFSNMPPSLIAGLSRFSALSFRDESTGRMLLSRVGRQGVPVIDPVFLHPIPPVHSEKMRRLTETPYVLFYHFGGLAGGLSAAFCDAVHQKGMKILGAGEWARGYDELSVNLTPFEVVHLFRHAAYVLTGTFHGVVLSLIHGVSFTVCPNNATRAQKVRSLLDEFNLTDRLVAAQDFDFSNECARTVDYESLTALLEKKRSSAIGYLSSALEHVKEEMINNEKAIGALVNHTQTPSV